MKKSLNVKTKVVYVHLEDVANVNPSGANVNPMWIHVNPMWIHVIKRHWIQKLKCYRLLKHDYNWIGSRSIRYVKHT